VLDPFGGTGTTALVAEALGRRGVSVDMSADYCRLAAWRTADPGQRAKALGVPKPPAETDDGQLDLLALTTGGDG
jgi:site-specific DNA-methyltransferase (cytosine-N4-specific)